MAEASVDLADATRRQQREVDEFLATTPEPRDVLQMLWRLQNVEKILRASAGRLTSYYIEVAGAEDEDEPSVLHELDELLQQ